MPVKTEYTSLPSQMGNHLQVLQCILLAKLWGNSHFNTLSLRLQSVRIPMPSNWVIPIKIPSACRLWPETPTYENLS